VSLMQGEWGATLIIFTLAALVSGMLLGLGLVAGVILYAWLYDRHRVRIEDMNRKAYMEVRAMEIKRMNAENERTRALDTRKRR